MIITARVAFEQAKQTSKESEKNIKNSIRQIRKIEKKINAKSKKGETSIKIYSHLNNDVIEELQRSGYRVLKQSNFDYDLFIISWGT